MGKGKMWVAFVAAVATLAAWAPGAQAAFSVKVNSAKPTTTTAGAHSDVVIDLAFPDTSQDIKNLDIDLPAGLLGNPNAVGAICTQAQFSGDNCPASSKVGQVSSVADTGTFLGDATVAGNVYLVTPTGSEPARMGIILKVTGLASLGAVTPISIQSPITLRAPGDYGLTSTIRGLPNTAHSGLMGTLNITIKTMTLTLYGTPPTSPKAPFLTNPTVCSPATFVVRGADYAAPNSYVSASAGFTPTGCDRTPFAPTFDISPKQQTADQPTPLSVTIGFPGDSGGTAQSYLKSAVVTLPVGTALSPGVGANGLDGCSDAQFAASAASAPSCPAASKIGDVSFATPLLGTLSGDVYLGAPTADAPLRLMAYATLGSVTVKLTGRVTPDPQTGQLTTTFTDLPEVPFTSFKLSFRGGDNAVLKAPSTCSDANTASARLEPYARPGTYTTPTASFSTVDCAAAPFAPSLSAGVTPGQATADTHMSMTIARDDAQPLLDGMNVSLPSGLLGHLADIPACAVDQARNGNCAETNRVGTVTAQAGTGNTPATLQGPIYLTGPVDGGLAGLAIVVPAKVGPIDLGKVVVVAKLQVRGDVGIDVSASGMPRIIGGVPLAIRSLKLDLDRDGFLFNASSCAAATVTAAFSAQNGATASASAPYQPTGCAGVPFAPTLTASIGGTVVHPSLVTTIHAVPGQATLAGAQLTLPTQVGADLNALSKVCMKDAYDAGNCPPVSTVGSATAVSPLIPIPLTGPVTLVRIPGRVLPSLAIDLSGVLNIHLMVDNDAAGGRIRSTVNGIPDVPLSTFTLTLNSGGLLKSDRSLLCKGTPKVDAAFTAHTGATTTTSAAADTPCSAGLAKLTVSASLRGTRAKRTPSLRVKVRGGNLRTLTLTLPKQLKVNGRKLRRGGRALQGGKTIRAKKALRHTSRTVKAVSTRPTSAIELRLAKGALRRGKGLKPNRKLTLKLRVTDRYGKSRALTVRVKARA